ncbi:MAG: von Willebrand factor type A domain-containing protein [Ruminococcus sp.]|nr:von Willebrand factor type A domain-containing protein [Ruminococcus sp.]
MKMNRLKKICAGAAALAMTVSLAGCGGAPEDSGNYALTTVPDRSANAENRQTAAMDSDGYNYAETADDYWDGEEFYEVNTEEYDGVPESGFLSVSKNPLSTFSADVDTASYSNLRRMINSGQAIDPDAVRIEEMINYFDYGYADPPEDEPFSVYTEYAPCPWNEETRLFTAGLSTKSRETVLGEREAMNIVFLIDVSGSMYSDDKLPLVQKSFSMLTDNLSEKDRISIVTYAGEDAVLLEGADGGDREEILKIINSLKAGGSTAGAAGIVTAYEIAEEYFIEGGNNRVILATDGDLNVGLSSVEELTELIEEKRETGVFLSVLGFGTGNYKDNRLEALADKGNGNYSYIDSEREAKKVLVDEMSGTLFTAAKDVKFQIEFNPAKVKGYRLIGYDNRRLADRDFADDTKDAGEVGAGHSVTVLYEIVPADGEMSGGDIELKYAQPEQEEESSIDVNVSNDLLTLSVRYKEPDGDESNLLEYPVSADDYRDVLSERLNFISACARFGMLLKNSPYCGDSTYDDVLKQLYMGDYSDDEYKDEFMYLVEKMVDRE